MPQDFKSQLFETTKPHVVERNPFLIAGPCSAETEEQVLKTAEAISASGKVNMFRAGAWKPRSRDGQFEGRGEQALEWLQLVKSQFDLPVMTETATPKHVELALKYDLDAIWIGARTSVSPFAMSELANALKGTNMMVFVKNPIAPDPALWIGAIERLQGAGIENVAAIHRGFSVFPKSKYRNAPLWELVQLVHAEFPSIPVICDPSHISGKRDRVKEVAYEALERGSKGLMIEVHTEPKEALSDALQQLYPDDFNEFVEMVKGSNVKPIIRTSS